MTVLGTSRSSRSLRTIGRCRATRRNRDLCSASRLLRDSRAPFLGVGSGEVGPRFRCSRRSSNRWRLLRWLGSSRRCSWRRRGNRCWRRGRRFGCADRRWGLNCGWSRFGFSVVDAVWLGGRFRWRCRGDGFGNDSGGWLFYRLGDGCWLWLWLIRRSRCSRLGCRLGNGYSGCGSFSLASIITFNGLLLEEAEDVVEDKVAVRLLGKEESLDEFPPWIAVVGHLTDDLDDNAIVCR